MPVDDPRKLAEEQAALRRVALLVARQASPEEFFTAVAREIQRTLELPVVVIERFEPDDTITVIGAAGRHEPFRVGTRWPLDPGASVEVRRTGRPAKADYRGLPGKMAEGARAGGFETGLGVPIIADGTVWGAIVTTGTKAEPLPDGAEERFTAFTELVAVAISNAKAREDLRRVVREQASLRRVATLVAQEASQAEVFAAVAREVAATLGVRLTAVIRYEPDGTATQVGVWGAENPFPVGTSWELDELSVSGRVATTGRPARVDYTQVPGEIAATLAREAGIRLAVGVPVLVDGKPWGAMMALSSEEQALPAGTEDRLAEFTELIATAIANAQARDDLRGLADEQAALRRVATLVAQGSEAAAVFDAVCVETGSLIGATTVNLARFTPDGSNLTMAGWSLRDTHVPTQTRLPIASDTINAVIRDTVAPARFDSYERATSPLGSLIRERGIRSEVGAPVLVEGELWGALIAGTDSDTLLPAGAERRIARFAELIATAVSNATTRSELIASRARIIAAGDEARRRVERNLHDGAQQRLVSLGLDLQALQAGVSVEREDDRAELERIQGEIDEVLEELRELSHGLHPALLHQGGLARAVRSLARKSPVAVTLDVTVPARLPEPVEIAVYYVVSESLANVAKHAGASEVSVSVAVEDGRVRATIADDGVGGAEASRGSGLVGLVDRVEALGGHLALDSPPDAGTTVSIELPLAD
jgi:signal transduction histidine kinase